MKKLTKGLLILVFLIPIFLLNPQDLYLSYKGKKEILSVSSTILEMFELQDAEIKVVKHMGGNVFLIETEDKSFLVERNRLKGRTEFKTFVEHDILFSRMDGLKPSFQIKVREFFGK